MFANIIGYSPASLEGALSFSNPCRLMNDPHGLIRFRTVSFYQHHPFNGKWGTMHWGHATSEDLIRGSISRSPCPSRIMMVGKVEESLGSAIEHQDELILFYTGCSRSTRQCMASSSDGYSFAKSNHNPVLADPPLESIS